MVHDDNLISIPDSLPELEATCGSETISEVVRLEELVREADEQNDVLSAYELRLQLIKTASLGGKDEHALEPLLWCLRWSDHRPDVFVPKPLLRRLKWVLLPMAHDSNYPRQMIEQMQDDFERRLVVAGFSPRPAHRIRLGHCLVMGDMDLAAEIDPIYRAAERDALSDCPACEQSDRVTYLQAQGKYAEALDQCQPILNGTLTCGSVPRGNYSDLVYCYHCLNKDHEIRRNFRSWYLDVANELGEITTVCTLMDFANWDGKHDVALRMFTRHAASAAASAFDLDRFYFYRSATALFLRLIARQRTIQVAIPPAWTCYRADGQYSTDRLTAWFFHQALEIGDRFDHRNGNRYYQSELNVGLQFSLGLTLDEVQESIDGMKRTHSLTPTTLSSN